MRAGKDPIRRFRLHNSSPSGYDDQTSFRPSIKLVFVRHAESFNNQVYADAHRLYNNGEEYNETGWNDYVERNRKADPGISKRGHVQSDSLGRHLADTLRKEDVSFVVSPMARTLDTIRPVLKHMLERKIRQGSADCMLEVMVQGKFYEVEGSHVRGVAKPGMNRAAVQQFLCSSKEGDHPKSRDSISLEDHVNLSFAGFPSAADEDLGWYAEHTTNETWASGEVRSAHFYHWLVDFLDLMQLDLENDNEGRITDKSKQSKKRTVVLVGHGDFMGRTLRRAVVGFGHMIENERRYHRAGFVHYNTGISELEYFGAGRFLLMNINCIPHLDSGPDDLKTGGRLGDGWAYMMPKDKHILNIDIDVRCYHSTSLEEHVQEQVDALRVLYLRDGEKKVSEEVSNDPEMITFIAWRGLQILGCVLFHEGTGRVKDMVVRPVSRRKGVGRNLVRAIKAYIREREGSNSSVVAVNGADEESTLGLSKVFVSPCNESLPFFQKVGFRIVGNENEDDGACSFHQLDT
mmetsp:Transcript_20185/g.45741  ORF Transcript_20185/g.45741 Transcript_20185/m.45741 type:complete len:518 (-) Transcript_20185:63-1616(-)